MILAKLRRNNFNKSFYILRKRFYILKEEFKDILKLIKIQ